MSPSHQAVYARCQRPGPTPAPGPETARHTADGGPAVQRSAHVSFMLFSGRTDFHEVWQHWSVCKQGNRAPVVAGYVPPTAIAFSAGWLSR